MFVLLCVSEQDVTDEYYDIIYTDGDKDEEIYEDVMNVQRKYLTERPLTIEPKSKRDHCLKELYETERNYVEALNMIIKVSVQYLFIYFITDYMAK